MDPSSPDGGETVHGVLVSIFDAGVLIIGESGIGKSECALELLSRGHGLVADDVVQVEHDGEVLNGSSPERFAGLLELRGLGICDVRTLFGNRSLIRRHKIDICVEFLAPITSGHRERIGADADGLLIAGTSIPRYIFDSDGRRNLALLVETAVRVYLGGTRADARLIAEHDNIVSGVPR
ncbi:hypothetical protein BH10ACI3_BH10ACI3_09310 [soil metagenome]